MPDDDQVPRQEDGDDHNGNRHGFMHALDENSAPGRKGTEHRDQDQDDSRER